MILDKFESSTQEVMQAMFNLAEIQPGEKHIDLGSGDGRFVVEALKRGAESIGYEIDEELAKSSSEMHGITIINKDCFEADVSEADVITCAFSKLPETRALMDKLRQEMKPGARFVKRSFTDHVWKPVPNNSLNTYQKETFQQEKVLRVDGQIICLYIKE